MKRIVLFITIIAFAQLKSAGYERKRRLSREEYPLFTIFERTSETETPEVKEHVVKETGQAAVVSSDRLIKVEKINNLLAVFENHFEVIKKLKKKTKQEVNNKLYEIYLWTRENKKRAIERNKGKEEADVLYNRAKSIYQKMNDLIKADEKLENEKAINNFEALIKRYEDSLKNPTEFDLGAIGKLEEAGKWLKKIGSEDLAKQAFDLRSKMIDKYRHGRV